MQSKGNNKIRADTNEMENRKTIKTLKPKTGCLK